MNTEEKALAYDKALERAKAIHDDKNASQIRKEWIEDIFPVLGNEENERIRETLVEYFGPQAQLDMVRGVPIQKIRNWLERQKREPRNASTDTEDKALRKALVDRIMSDVGELIKGAEKRLYEPCFVPQAASDEMAPPLFCESGKIIYKPKWKPSKSQMYALKVALETFRVRNSDNISAGNDKVFTQIESLYKDLSML